MGQAERNSATALPSQRLYSRPPMSSRVEASTDSTCRPSCFTRPTPIGRPTPRPTELDGAVRSALKTFQQQLRSVSRSAYPAALINRMLTAAHGVSGGGQLGTPSGRYNSHRRDVTNMCLHPSMS